MEFRKIFSSDCTYVSKLDKGTNFSNDKNMYVGPDIDNTTFYLSILKFKEISELSNIDIKKAHLGIFVSDDLLPYEQAKFKDIIIYKNLQNFDEKTITWLNKPAISPTYALLEHVYKGYIEFDITELAIEWNNSSTESNFGITIGINLGVINKYFTFNSSKNNDEPYIAIEYENKKETFVVNSLNNIFVENFFNIKNTNTEFYSQTIDISNLLNGIYIIKNIGAITLLCIAQISPNNGIYIDYTESVTIEPNSCKYLVVPILSKYSRLKFISNEEDATSNVQIWFQGQTVNFKLS